MQIQKEKMAKRMAMINSNKNSTKGSAVTRDVQSKKGQELRGHYAAEKRTVGATVSLLNYQIENLPPSRTISNVARLRSLA